MPEFVEINNKKVNKIMTSQIIFLLDLQETRKSPNSHLQKDDGEVRETLLHRKIGGQQHPYNGNKKNASGCIMYIHTDSYSHCRPPINNKDDFKEMY